MFKNSEIPSWGAVTGTMSLSATEPFRLPNPQALSPKLPQP